VYCTIGLQSIYSDIVTMAACCNSDVSRQGRTSVSSSDGSRSCGEESSVKR